MGVSRSAFARMVGVSEGAVRKAIKTGRITLQDDGTIDPDAARAAWAGTTDPARTRVRGTKPAPMPAAVVETEDDAREAINLIARVLQEEGAPELRTIDFDAARTAETILKARERDLRMQVARGKLVDAERVGKVAFDVARRARDAWMNWPSRVAPLIAASLGCDQVNLAVELENHVRQHLAEHAERERPD